MRGRPLSLIITAGQVGDITQASALLDGQDGNAVLATKPATATPCAAIAGLSADAVIPSNRCRKIASHDAIAYVPQPHRTALQQAQALPHSL